MGFSGEGAAHVGHAVERVFIVRRGFFESEAAVKADRGLQAVEGIEKHGPVAHLGGAIHGRDRQALAEAMGAISGANIQPLEFTGGFIDLLDRDAGDGSRSNANEPQTAVWRAVLAGQMGDFLFEPLEAQVGIELGGVGQKQVAHVGHVVGIAGFEEGEVHAFRLPGR